MKTMLEKVFWLLGLSFLATALAAQVVTQPAIYPLHLDSGVHWFSADGSGRMPMIRQRGADQPVLNQAERHHETSMQQLQEKLAHGEVAADVFAISRMEPLLELADFYRAAGNPQQEIAVLEEVLHISRINYGLYHPEHLETLQRLVDAAIANRDADRARDYQLSLLHMNQRLHGPDNPALAKAYLDWADWNLTVYMARVELGIAAQVSPNRPLPDINLVESLAFYQKAIELLHVGHDPGQDTTRFHLQESIKKLQLLNLSARGQLPAAGWSTAQAGDVLGHVAMLHELNQLPGFFADFGNLHRSITRNRHVSQGGKPLELVHLIEESDWQMLVGNYHQALAIQGRADVLANTCADPCATLANLLVPGLPIAMPEEWLHFRGHDLQFSGYIDVEFRINRNARAENIVVTHAANANARVTDAVLRKVRMSVFRLDHVDPSRDRQRVHRVRYYFG
jgi:hypothetical protein